MDVKTATCGWGGLQRRLEISTFKVRIACFTAIYILLALLYSKNLSNSSFLYLSKIEV
jgi:hypothetical protein